ncbi:MAG: hypothetical protein JJU05_16045 [Verrucomicrobia bacterium]|nr:hypothetical protein [Verrucomicrobiota bacterium]MCH8528896.1 PRC-barrel domain-containing protein [Kiritimatiellia bacterium]
MYFSAKSIAGFKLNSLDGELGGVKDLFFDDQDWSVRFLVARTGLWLTSRQVLISPRSDLKLRPGENQMHVHLTRPAVLDSPALRSDLPVSLQFPGEPNLCSARKVRGYEVRAGDGTVGFLDDYILDDSTWRIRYLIVDLRHRIPGRKVLISPQWIERMNRDENVLFLDLTPEAVDHSPEYCEKALLNGELETGPHTPYDRAACRARERGDSREHYLEAVEDWDNEGGGVPTVCVEDAAENFPEFNRVETFAAGSWTPSA